jgi:hypothetical protein
MFAKLVLLLTALSNADGRKYLRGPGSNLTANITVPTSNMSTALTIIPDKSVALYNMKQKKPKMCVKPTWASQLVLASNSSRNEL